MASRILNYKGKPFVEIHVDDADADLLNRAWFVSFATRRRKTNYFQIKRNLTVSEQAIFGKTKIYLHQEVWIRHNGPIEAGKEVDHFDFNTANNQTSNLQLMDPKHHAKRRTKEYLKTFVGPIEESQEINYGEQMAQTANAV